ncbi:putative transcription regulator SOH1 family [Helianthus annuus]|nr:putative transcription regulator SOH1 family [Helianthus annuus]
MASGQEIDDSSNNNSSPKKVYKDPDDGRQRFLLELEFVQCLANPTYIHCIHIYFLELLQNASFCNAMAHPANKSGRPIVYGFGRKRESMELEEILKDELKLKIALSCCPTLNDICMSLCL